MNWLRIDDTFVDHPKLISLGPIGARWAFLELLSYCARHRTEGYFPLAIGESHRRLTPAFIERCLAVGLVDQSDDGELRVHDFAEYNPVKDVTGAVRQQRWRNTHRNAGVTENVTGDVTASRVGERARPVPSPTPRTSKSENQGLTEARPPARPSANERPGISHIRETIEQSLEEAHP